jgi:hypothetical protein
MSKKFESNMQRRWLRKGRELQRRKTEFARMITLADSCYNTCVVIPGLASLFRVGR